MRRESLSRKCFNVFNVVFMIALMVVMVFPYLNVMAKAFNDGKDTAMGGIVILPRVFTLSNFEAVLKAEAFPRAALVSVVRVIVGVVISVCVQFMAAYVFTYKNLIGRSSILMFLMIPMYFGGGLIPTYIMYSKLELLNNYLLYVLPGCFSLYNMTIIKSYMNTLPDGLKEAAKIDGARELTILWKIVFPLSKPIMATIALWTAVSHWSDWTTTMYFFTKKKMFTLQYLLQQVLKEAQMIQKMIDEAALYGEDLSHLRSSITTDAIRCAQVIVTTVPIIIVYPFLQKYFIQGVTLGAVKD